MPLATVEQSIEEIRKGKMIILVDDEDRENEGDLFCAAEKVTPEIIAFMATHGRGLICLTMTEEDIDRLQLHPMTPHNTSPFGTAFHVSIEARRGVTTGISAHDRATTILTAIDPKSGPMDLVQPGHVFPLKAKLGGVLRRTGQTEGSVDLARLAGLRPAGVICEVMKDDGTMARMPDLRIFAKKHNLKILTIADLIAYRLKHESLVKREAETTIPTTDSGEWNAYGYSSIVDNQQHLALVKGDVAGDEPVYVRVHSECLTGDVFHSLRCDCGDQLHQAMKVIHEAGKGAVIYMHQEGRGIGLINKLKAYALQDEGCDTVEANIELGFKADLRDYGLGAQIIKDLGIRKLKILTNNPKKIIGLEGYGLEVVERAPIEIPATDINRKYLECKREKMGHLLKLQPKS